MRGSSATAPRLKTLQLETSRHLTRTRRGRAPRRAAEGCAVRTASSDVAQSSPTSGVHFAPHKDCHGSSLRGHAGRPGHRDSAPQACSRSDEPTRVAARRGHRAGSGASINRPSGISRRRAAAEPTISPRAYPRAPAHAERLEKILADALRSPDRRRTSTPSRHADFPYPRLPQRLRGECVPVATASCARHRPEDREAACDPFSQPLSFVRRSARRRELPSRLLRRAEVTDDLERR